MKTYPRLFRKLFCEPLLLHAPARASFESELLRRMYGDHASIPVAIADPGGIKGALGDPGRPKEDWINFEKDVAAYQDQMRLESIYTKIGPVAVIKIDGVIDKRVSQMELDCYGAVDLADVDRVLSVAMSDPSVKIVVLDIHSPGGSVVGVHETYTRIMALAETKEVHAFVNAMACSAGYYLASAADHIAAAPSAIVGSIGVYLAMLDASRWYEEEGLKINVMQGGKWKTMGAEWKELSDEERTKLQTGVDAMYAQFKAAVNEKRPQVEDDTMQGQWMTAAEGQPLGLVDELTGATLDEYVSALL